MRAAPPAYAIMPRISASAERPRLLSAAPAGPAPGLLSPGFAGRLVAAGCMAVLAAYAVLAGLTVARRGGPLPFVVTSDLISNLTGAALLEQGQGVLLYDRAAQTAAQTAILQQGGQGLVRLLPFVHLPF